ncbi:maestro heat-like repeat-containing protein family member 2B isoform X2 [Mauremys reevesii]|uniref:maestro heat-like repeat-containing protein family member 2B isoform X2 n=1 Tax=Mauremys reevesii TaxID=260615 RepID=UPI00193FDDD5|nr:maestro heat-like repeat-containing protein family member 2B isoform X2 [Mauremys reevesii]
MNNLVSELEVTERGVYNEVISLLAHIADQDKNRIALRIASIAKTKLVSVVRVLLEKLQQDEEATNEVKVAASNTLVTLASCYFDDVMYELHCHLKPPKLPEEFILVTLGNLSSAYVLEQWSRAVRLFLASWEKYPFPKVGELRLCNHFLPVYSHVTSNWLTCEELELKQAVIKALGPMMSLLLHKEEYQGQIFEQMSWLLEQYKESTDVFHVTKSLSQLLEVSGEYKIPLPKRKFQAICSALHNQLCSQAKPLSMENHTELVYCIVQLARSSPDDLIAFLHSQLEIENEAVRVASLNLLRAIVGADCK